MRLDFSSYVAERREGYTPRPWLMERIAAWYADPARPRFFSIVGEPGSGKTAVAAQLITGSAPPVAAYHFCSARKPNWQEPSAFVSSMSGQLVDNVPGFRDALLASSQQRFTLNIDAKVHAEVAMPGSTQNAVNIPITAGSAQSQFGTAIRDPLQRLYDGGFDGDVVLLVDALDEGDLAPGPEKIGDLLAALNDLPARVRAIVTSRPALPTARLGDAGDVVRLQLGAAELAVTIGDDVERHVRRSLAAAPDLVKRLALPEPQFVRQFRERAAGNFLWAGFALGMLRQGTGPIDAAALQALPSGLPDLYGQFLDRIVRGDMARWRAEHSVVLGTLAVTQEELTVEQLAHYTGLAEAVIHQVLDEADQLLEPTTTEPVAYRVYHQSFLDYILDAKAAKRYACRPGEQHARFAEAWARDTELRNWKKSDDYAIRRIATHLAGLADQERWREALFALLSREWMEAKRERLITDVSFAADVALIAETAAAMQPRRVVEELTARCILATLRSRVQSIPEAALALMARLGDSARAISWCSLVDDRSRPTALLAIAQALSQHDPEREEGLLREVLASGAQTEHASDLLVANLTRRGRFEEALEAVRGMTPIRGYAPGVVQLSTALLAAHRFDGARELAGMIDDEHWRQSLLTDVAAALAGAGRIDETLPLLGQADVARVLPHVASVDAVRALQLAGDSWHLIEQVLRVSSPRAAVAAAEQAGLLENDAVQYTLGAMALEGSLEETRLLKPRLRDAWRRRQVTAHEAVLRVAEEGIEAAEQIVRETAEDEADAVRAALAAEAAARGRLDIATALIAAIAEQYARVDAAGAAMRKILSRERDAQAAFPLIDALSPDRKELLPRLVAELGETGLSGQWPAVLAAARDEDERAHTGAAAGAAALEAHGPAAALAIWHATQPWPSAEASSMAAALVQSGHIDEALEVLPGVQWLDAAALRALTIALSRRGEWEHAGGIAVRFHADTRLRAVLLADRAQSPEQEPPLRDVARWLDAGADAVYEAIDILRRRNCHDAAARLSGEELDAMPERAVPDIEATPAPGSGDAGRLIERLAEEHDWNGAARLLPFITYDHDRLKAAGAIATRAVEDAAAGLTREPYTACIAALREAGMDLDAIAGDRDLPPAAGAAIVLAVPEVVSRHHVERIAVALAEKGDAARAWELIATIDVNLRGSTAVAVARAIFASGDAKARSTVRSLDPPLLEEVAAALAGDLLEKDPAAAAGLFRELTAGIPRTWTSRQFASELARAGRLWDAVEIVDDARPEERDWQRGWLAEQAAGHVGVDELFDVAPRDAVARIVARLVETDGPRFARSMWEAWRRREESPENLTTAAAAFLRAGDEETARSLMDELFAVVEGAEDTYQRNYALLEFLRVFLQGQDEDAARRTLAQIPPGAYARALALEDLAVFAARRGESDRARDLVDKGMDEALGKHNEIAARLAVLDLDLGGTEALQRYLSGEEQELLALSDALAGGDRGSRWKRWSKDRRRRQLLKDALELAKDDADALSRVAVAAAAIDPGTARKALQRAAATGSDDLTVTGRLAVARFRLGDREEGDDAELAAAVVDRALLLDDYAALDALRSAVSGFSESREMLLTVARHLRTRLGGDKQAVVARAMADCAIRARDGGLLAEALAALQSIEYDISPTIGETLRQLAGADPKAETIDPWIAATEREIARNPNPDSVVAQRADLAPILLRRGRRDDAFATMWAAFESPHLPRPAFFHVLDRSIPLLRSLDPDGRTWRALAERILDVETWWVHRASAHS
ncbi:MAG TPA: hypothetical protein VF432_13260 [Thermoanaerobaculia bacterium]